MMKSLVIALLAFVTRVGAVNITFNPDFVTLYVGEIGTINYTIEKSTSGNREIYRLYSEDLSVLVLPTEVIIDSFANSSGFFDIEAKFIGRTAISCKNNATELKENGQLSVRIIREPKAIDTVFVVSVATLVSIIYINFGCALDWNEPKKIFKKPIGPLIGFTGQFVVMPLLSYGIGLLIFPDNPEMRLGMFFVGTSPGGGASNIWTILLGGNLNLSVIMSAVSTISAFAMMPLWVFTLGKVIFDQADLEVPYGQISTYVIGLVVPLAVGFLIQKYLPKISRFFVKIMKGFSVLLIIFIIVFAIVTNLYLFEIFSWEIIFSGMASSWLGYLAGFLIAKIFRQSGPDSIAIALEVGIQNTGIAIFLLRVSLPQPEADLTTVVPVANAILTPIPLMVLYIYFKISNRFSSNAEIKVDSNCDTSEKHKEILT